MSIIDDVQKYAKVTDLASALAALEFVAGVYENVAPTVAATIEYLRKNNITDEDIVALKAQDKAAADNQQSAIDQAKAEGR